MTLAGTRPILQDELRQYELHHRARIAIKPGITGMWQVSGRSDITDFEEVVRLDASGYFASGKHAAEYFIYFGADEKKIYYHPFTSLHSSEIYEYPALEQEKIALRTELGLSNQTTYISIGQFIPRKGFDVLLNAWKEYDNENQLLIIGGGDEKEKYENTIRQRYVIF